MSLEEDVALVYANCTKVRTESQIFGGGVLRNYKAVAELHWGTLEEIVDCKAMDGTIKKGELVVWGIFTFERLVEEINYATWNNALHVVKKRAMLFGIAPSVAALMRQAAEYCKDEPNRNITKTE